MPLRTAVKLCPHAIFLDGHPDLYREYSQKAGAVLRDFSPAVEMASIDEAYVDMSGTQKLHGPPLRSAHKLHHQMKKRTGLKCSIGFRRPRLVGKNFSRPPQPHRFLFFLPRPHPTF